MATTAWREKQKLAPKFSTRAYLRCSQCGRAHAVYRRFGICRLCFRKLASIGVLPGVRKSSW